MKNKKPPKVYKRTTVFMEPVTFKLLKLLAVEQDKGLGDCFLEAVKDYLKKHKKI